jgi:hypothetical protein
MVALADLTEDQRARLLEIRQARLRELLASRTFTRTQKLAMRELLADRRRPNAEIAAAIGCGKEVVRRARLDLERARVIGAWRAPSVVPRQPQHPGRNRLREAVAAALLANPERSNTEIGAEAGCGREVARRVRHALEERGSIEPWRPPPPDPPPPPRRVPRPAKLPGLRGLPQPHWPDRRCPLRDRAAGELRANPERTNPEIAAVIGCGPELVRRVRHVLEARGDIERWRTPAAHYPAVTATAGLAAASAAVAPATVTSVTRFGLPTTG